MPKSLLVSSGVKFGFHVDKVPYSIDHKYNPDFTVTFPDKTIFIEAKGYFQDAHEVQKYPWIKKVLGSDQELVFVFENPDKPIHFKSVRKCGTKMTHAEYCEKNGFRYFTIDNVGEIL